MNFVMRDIKKIVRCKEVRMSECIHCYGRMYVTWIKAPQWCAWQQKKNKKIKIDIKGKIAALYKHQLWIAYILDVAVSVIRRI